MGMEANLWRTGDEAVVEVALGPAFEGAPGQAHGGVVAALFDEVMGLALSVTGSLAFTGKLAVTYQAPTRWASRCGPRPGRRTAAVASLTIAAELHSGPTLLAEAEGLFIAVRG